MASNKNSNGPKAFASIIAIVALISGVAAIVRPMQLNIDALHDQVEKLERRHQEDLRYQDEKLRIEIKELSGRLGKEFQAEDRVLRIQLEEIRRWNMMDGKSK